MAEVISGDKFATECKINVLTGYCACTDINVTKVTENLACWK